MKSFDSVKDNFVTSTLAFSEVPSMLYNRKHIGHPKFMERLDTYKMKKNYHTIGNDNKSGVRLSFDPN